MLDATERVSTVIVIDGAPGDHTLTFGGFLFSLLGASGSSVSIFTAWWLL
jgi:hypothetical protein